MNPTIIISLLAVFSAAQALPADNGLVSVLSITKSKQDTSDACIYDYNLDEKFKDLPTPKWLNSWDDVMFNSFCESKYDVKMDPNADKQQQAEMLAFSLASGYSIDLWHPPTLKKRFPGADLQSMVENFWETGVMNADQEQLAPSEIEQEAGKQTYAKRAMTHVMDREWIYDDHNLSPVSLMRSVQRMFEDKGSQSMRFKKRAVCHEHDIHRACFSWVAGDSNITGDCGSKAINNAIAGRGDHEWISAFARDVLKETLWVGFWMDRYSRACVSSRPDHCG